MSQLRANVILADLYKDQLVAQINRTAKTWAILPERPAFSSDIKWVVRGAGATARTHADGAAFDTASFDAQVAASLEFGSYDHRFSAGDKLIAQALRNGNPAEQASILLNGMKGGVEVIAKLLNQDIFSGTGANSIIGFDDAIGTIGNTYATVNRGTHAFFDPNVFTNIGNPLVLTKQQIRNDMAAIEIESGKRPDLIVVNPMLFNVIHELFDKSVTFVQNDGGLVSRLGGMVPQVFIDGALVVSDVDGYADVVSQQASLYYLNTEYVYKTTLPYVGSTFQMAGGSLPYNMDLVEVAKTAHASDVVVRVSAQIVVERPNAMGVRTNISIDPDDYKECPCPD